MAGGGAVCIFLWQIFKTGTLAIVIGIIVFYLLTYHRGYVDDKTRMTVWYIFVAIVLAVIVSVASMVCNCCLAVCGCLCSPYSCTIRRCRSCWCGLYRWCCFRNQRTEDEEKEWEEHNRIHHPVEDAIKED